MADFYQLSPEEWALLVLSLTDGIGPVTARALIEEMGSAAAVVSATAAELASVPNVRPKLARLLLSGDGKRKAEEELAKLNQLASHGVNIQMLFTGSPNYPAYLDHCFDAPLVLYVRGQVPNTPMISIVGTRKNTVYAQDLLQYLMQGIATHRPDITIVSGLAYGVDKLAHQTALAHGLKSVGVVAHGHYTLYPSSHRRLAETMMAQGGGIVTEYPYDTRALPQRFVQRNRIVAGLSHATLVIESAERGGSLITANIAFDYGRSLFAAPGRVFDPASAGCNRLIERQKASIITSPEQILREINLLPDLPQQPMLPFAEEQPDQDPIIHELRTSGELTLEDLSLRLGEDVPTISGRLFDLELDGLIRSLPGSRYCIKNY